MLTRKTMMKDSRREERRLDEASRRWFEPTGANVSLVDGEWPASVVGTDPTGTEDDLSSSFLPPSL